VELAIEVMPLDGFDDGVKRCDREQLTAAYMKPPIKSAITGKYANGYSATECNGHDPQYAIERSL
jgi:hypothetical protein